MTNLPHTKMTPAQLSRAQLSREIACPDKRYWTDDDTRATIIVWIPLASRCVVAGWDHDGKTWWDWIDTPAATPGQRVPGQDELGLWLPTISPVNVNLDYELIGSTVSQATKRWRQKRRGEYVMASAPVGTFLLSGLVRGSPAVYRVLSSPEGGKTVEVWRAKSDMTVEKTVHPLLPNMPGSDDRSAVIGGIHYRVELDGNTLTRIGVPDPNAPQDRPAVTHVHRAIRHAEQPELSRLLPDREAWYTINPAPGGRLRLLVSWPDSTGRVRHITPSIKLDGSFMFCDRPYKINSVGEVVTNDRD